jgi:RNA polymerase sigma factor (sigma-70 family)
MSIRSIEVLQRYLRRLCDEAVPAEDAVLLKRFVAAKDREAFELLIARHGPMVLGTAGRFVDNSHDAEDVFQAVFLSLARLAKTIRHGRALPAWLHKTTCRIAAKVRTTRVPRSQAELGNEKAAPEPSDNIAPEAQLVWQEVRQALDEELQRLPERLRSPLLLCYLSGLTRDEAAKQLGWSLGTLKRRLEEGRQALRLRLAKRGIASVGLALTVLTPEALQAAVSKSLVDSCLNLVFSTGAVVPATIAALVLGSAGIMKGLAMKSLLALVAAIALGVGIYAGTGEVAPPKIAEAKKEEVKPPQKEQVGQLDDPLPTGSTLRFGTSRFRLGIPISTMAVSADGKLAVAVNPNHILGAARVFDLVSGRALYTIGRSGGHDAAADVEAAWISPDGRTIVTKQDFSLRVRDAATGRELRKFDLPRPNSWSSNEWVAFTPHAKAIAVTSQGGVIHLVDVETGKTIRDFSNANPESSLKGWDSVLGIAFSQDGKLMASGGFNNDKGTYFARLWEVETGKELRRFRHAKNSYGIPSLAFSPDAKTLATRSHDGRLRLFDVDTGKERKTFPSDGGGRRLGTVAFSPDGQTVAAAGDSIRLYDVTTGEERLRIGRKQATGLRFTEGGKTLTGAVMGAIYRWDTATGKALTPEGGDSIVEQILVTVDGRRVVTRGQNGDAHIWDAVNAKHLRALDAAWQSGIALSPDGRFLVWPILDESVRFKEPQDPSSIYYGSRLRLYDTAADKLVDRFPGFKGDADDLMFTEAGRKLITVDRRNAMVFIWDFEAGKEERSFQAVPEADKKLSTRVWRTALSPDGKTLAVASEAARAIGGAERLGMRNSPHFVRLWDVASGQQKHTLEGHRDRSYVLDMAFSPDGRLLVTASEQKGSVFVWETATGKRVAALPEGLPIGATAVAFSSDGRFLATALPEGALRVWEVATWTVQDEFKGHRDRPTALTFAPSGQLLSGSLDTTVLAWDTRPARTAAGSLETAWIDLAKQESRQAFKSAGRFLAAPPAAVKFFADKIKPVQPPDAKRIQQLLADLDSAQFARRDSASRALSDLGQQAKPYVEEAVKATKSIEFLRRAQKILDGLKKLTPEEIRQTRAVLVLELIDNDDSRNLLKNWAGGLRGALLTEEASAALRRLEGAAKAKR